MARPSPSESRLSSRSSSRSGRSSCPPKLRSGLCAWNGDTNRAAARETGPWRQAPIWSRSLWLLAIHYVLLFLPLLLPLQRNRCCSFCLCYCLLARYMSCCSLCLCAAFYFPTQCPCDGHNDENGVCCSVRNAAVKGSLEARLEALAQKVAIWARVPVCYVKC